MSKKFWMRNVCLEITIFPGFVFQKYIDYILWCAISNSQMAEGQLKPKIINRGRSIYFPTLLFLTPKLKALIQKQSCHQFCSQLQSWRLYNSIVQTFLFSTPNLKALIQQYSANTFVLNSKMDGTCTTIYLLHVGSQIQSKMFPQVIMDI